MACEEETVSPDDQWSFLRMEVKKKLPPLAGFNLRSNCATGKYSWGLCKGPSILKHPPNRQLRTLGRARDKSCSSTSSSGCCKANAQSHSFAPPRFPTRSPRPPVNSQPHSPSPAPPRTPALRWEEPAPQPPPCCYTFPTWNTRLCQILGHTRRNTRFLDWEDAEAVGPCWSCRL